MAKSADAKKIARRPAKDFIAKIEAYVPEPGTEVEYHKYVEATKELEAEWAYNDVLFKKAAKGRDPDREAAFAESIAKIGRLQKKVLGAFDMWNFTKVHLHDRVPVAEEETRLVVIDSLSDKLDELQFSINVGLLGSKVAQAIRMDAFEESMGDPPLCGDCQE